MAPVTLLSTKLTTTHRAVWVPFILLCPTWTLLDVAEWPFSLPRHHGHAASRRSWKERAGTAADNHNDDDGETAAAGGVIITTNTCRIITIITFKNTNNKGKYNN